MDGEAVLHQQPVAHRPEREVIGQEDVARAEQVGLDVPPVEVAGAFIRPFPVRGDGVPCLMEAVDVGARQQVIARKRDVGEPRDLLKPDDPGPGEQRPDALGEFATELVAKVRERALWRHAEFHCATLRKI